MNIEERLLPLLKSVFEPLIPVTVERIDPYEQDSIPAINIRYATEDYEYLSNDPTYKVTTTINIGCFVKGTEDYYTKLKQLTTNIKNTIFTDPILFSLYEHIPTCKVQYDYVDSGEVNFGQAVIQLVIEDSEIFVPNITGVINRVQIGLDNANPFDHNLAIKGPDGRIEITAPFELTI